MPQVSASRCSSRLKEAEGGSSASEAHQDRVVRLEDLIEEAEQRMVESSYCWLILWASWDGAVHDVVHGPQGDRIIEEVAEQFDRTAGRTMADQP